MDKEALFDILINWLSNLGTTKNVAKAFGVDEGRLDKSQLLWDFKHDANEAECDPDGFTEEQDATFDAMVYEYVDKILNLRQDDIQAEDLIGALFQWGSDVELIENMERAEAVAKVINEATSLDAVKRNTEDWEWSKTLLNLTDENTPRQMYWFVNGCTGCYCLAPDWDVKPSNNI